MATMTTYDMVGKKEDVSDVITNISPTKTPFTSLTGAESITQTIHSWQEDALMPVSQAPAIEGADAPAAVAAPTELRQNTTQIFTKVAQTSGTSDAIKTHGRDKELAYQLAKRSAELKRDFEYALVGTGQGMVLGNDATARLLAGYQGQIDPSVSVNVAGAFTETALLGLLQTLYVNGAEPDTVMVKPSDSTKVAAFTQNSGRVKYVDNADKKIVNVVDVYVSPFGEQKIIINRFQAATNALVFEAAMWKRLTLRNWFRETLAKTGDSTKVQIVGEFSLKHKNYNASGLLTGLT